MDSDALKRVAEELPERFPVGWMPQRPSYGDYKPPWQLTVDNTLYYEAGDEMVRSDTIEACCPSCGRVQIRGEDQPPHHDDCPHFDCPFPVVFFRGDTHLDTAPEETA
jgi:hypothetical protein